MPDVVTRLCLNRIMIELMTMSLMAHHPRLCEGKMATNRKTLAYHISNLPHISIPRIEDFHYSVQHATHKIPAFSKRKLSIKEPKLSQWDYLDQEKAEILLKLKDQKEIYDFIALTLKAFPKGRAKDIFIDLIRDVRKFCVHHDYDAEKVATVLSQFYLTHVYFTSGLEVTAEKVYLYFKDLMLCHSLPFPPSKKKVFTLKEARDILEFFCKVYLRNLPLIRYLSSPNFALYLNYEIPPPPVFLKEKKKDKKGRGKGDKKGKKK